MTGMMSDARILAMELGQRIPRVKFWTPEDSTQTEGGDICIVEGSAKTGFTLTLRSTRGQWGVGQLAELIASAATRESVDMGYGGDEDTTWIYRMTLSRPSDGAVGSARANAGLVEIPICLDAKSWQQETDDIFGLALF